HREVFRTVPETKRMLHPGRFAPGRRAHNGARTSISRGWTPASRSRSRGALAPARGRVLGGDHRSDAVEDHVPLDLVHGAKLRHDVVEPLPAAVEARVESGAQAGEIVARRGMISCRVPHVLQRVDAVRVPSTHPRSYTCPHGARGGQLPRTRG